MDIAVLGGTGTIGRKVVSEAVARGHVVRVISRQAPATSVPRTRHVALDVGSNTLGEESLQEAFADVDCVIDTVNGGSRVLVEGLGRLLEAEHRLGVPHHLAISIVGCDRVPFGYYQSKARQEQVLADGAVPWSVLRSTQFHDLIAGLVRGAARLRLRPTGSLLFQPVEPAAVASLLVDAAEAGPVGRLTDVGGPVEQSLGELSADWARNRGRRLMPVRLGIPGRIGSAVRTGALCPGPGADLVGMTFGQWDSTQA